MTAAEPTPRYMPQLDSLRAFAVGGVMLGHFHSGTIANYIPLGLGVELFFVLSGFLITSILLRGAPTMEFVSSFYIRRALRLFPLYYLVIVIVAIFSPEMRNAWRFYALYGANFWVVENLRWGVATHFWSLAVEEQFYLIWPLVVLWTPRRALVHVCVILIVVAPLFRLSGVLAAHNTFAIVLLPGSVDALACGGLLALFGPPRLTERYMFAAAASAVAILLCYNFGKSSIVINALFTLALPLFYVLVSGAAHGFAGRLGCVLLQRPLRYLGKISYGLYVIHYFVPQVLGPYLWQALEPHLPQTVYVIITVVVYSAASVALAALSWRFIEHPINRNRDRIVGAIIARPRLIVATVKQNIAARRNFGS